MFLQQNLSNSLKQLIILSYLLFVLLLLFSFPSSKFIKSSSKGQLNVIAVTPAPKPHSLPRDVNMEGTHLVLKTDINEFGDAEVQQMSIT